VHAISIRYPHLMCNTRGWRVTRQTAVPASRVPDTRTPVRVSSSLLRTYPPTQRSVAQRWWTLRSVSLLHEHPSTRHHQPHVLATVAVCRRTLDCSAVTVPEPTGAVHVVWRVPMGDAPVYLRETSPCTYRRRPVYLRETKYDRTLCS
jgi:hypothetical protein